MKKRGDFDLSNTDKELVVESLKQFDVNPKKKKRKKKVPMGKKLEKNDPPHEPRVYVYTRVSTSKQTITSQDAGITLYLKRNGITEYTHISEAVTGTKEISCRNLGQLIKDLKRGDKLIVSEISRIGRSMLIIVNVMSVLISKGVELISVKENFRLDNTPTSKLILEIYSYTSETEHALIVSRTREGVQKAKERGVKFGRTKGVEISWYKIDRLGQEKFLALLNRGVPKKKIAKKFNVNRSSIYYYIKKKSKTNFKKNSY